MTHNRLLPLCWPAVLVMAGCREPAGESGMPASQPKVSHAETSDPPTARPVPATVPVDTRPPTTTQFGIAAPGQVVIFITDPNDPQTGWLRIETIEKSGEPASATGTVVKPRKLIITTKNVGRIRIDLPKAGMPSNKRVLLQIDDQGIEITGRRGPIGYFERSKNGAWSAAATLPAKKK